MEKVLVKCQSRDCCHYCNSLSKKCLHYVWTINKSIQCIWQLYGSVFDSCDV